MTEVCALNNSPDAGGAIVAGILLLYGFFILIGIASFVFWIIELIDVCRREFRDPNTKLLWVLMVVFLHGLGALIYFFAGKSQGWLPGEAPLYPQYPRPPYPPQGQWPPPPGQNYGQTPYPQDPYALRQILSLRPKTSRNKDFGAVSVRRA